MSSSQSRSRAAIRGSAGRGSWLRSMLRFRVGRRFAAIAPEAPGTKSLVRLEVGTTKNDEGRELPFGGYPQLRAVLVEALEDTRRHERGREQLIPHVFHRAGQAIRDFRAQWDRPTEAAGVPATVFHDLRRTAARVMVDAGIPRSRCMRRTGHKTESMFERYNIKSRDQAREGTARMGEAVDEARRRAEGTEVTPLRPTGSDR